MLSATIKYQIRYLYLCLRLVIAITGASGVIYGIRTLEVLKKLKVETHL
ncbi:MAG TPA: flavoprotein, partial [Nitrososphaera sp.]